MPRIKRQVSMNDEEGVSVFIPVYNGKNMIASAVEKTNSFLKKNFSKFEIVVVDDNSNDGTVSVLKSLRKKIKSLRIVTNEKGPSRRENLAKAMLSAKYDFLMYQDADLVVSVKFIKPLFFKLIKDDFDVSIGSRYKGIAPNRSLLRLLISKLFNFSLNAVFRTQIRDHICGFKAFKKKVYKDLYSSLNYDYTGNRGWFWDAELLIRSRRKNYSIYELPVMWIAGKKSTFNILRELRILCYLVKFLFNMFKNG